MARLRQKFTQRWLVLLGVRHRSAQHPAGQDRRLHLGAPQAVTHPY